MLYGENKQKMAKKGVAWKEQGSEYKYGENKHKMAKKSGKD